MSLLFAQLLHLTCMYDPKWHQSKECCICSWFVCSHWLSLLSLVWTFCCWCIVSLDQVLKHFTTMPITTAYTFDSDHKALKAFWINESILKTHQPLSSSSWDHQVCGFFKSPPPWAQQRSSSYTLQSCATPWFPLQQSPCDIPYSQFPVLSLQYKEMPAFCCTSP